MMMERLAWSHPPHLFFVGDTHAHPPHNQGTAMQPGLEEEEGRREGSCDDGCCSSKR